MDDESRQLSMLDANGEADGLRESGPADTAQASAPQSPRDSGEEREWTGEQAAAIAASGRYVFCEAGAGSGKTGVLVERYCDAIERAERGTDAVLAFTFTEKAASELRTRIRARLRERAEAAANRGDDIRAATLREYSREPGAWITTIHGFCQRLIASHPVAAGVGGGFRVLDAAEAALIAERAFALAFEQFLTTPERPRLAIAAVRGPNVLRDMVVGVHDELRSLGQEAPVLPDPPAYDLAALLADLRHSAELAIAATADARGALAPVDRAAMATAIELADGGAEAIDVDQLLGLKPNSKAKAFKGPEVSAYKAAIAALVGPLSIELYNAARELVALFADAYREAKRHRSGLDFEDLQLLAVALLESSPAIRESYRARFSEILVDEFQDTNRLQVKLIESLRGEATQLFTVGDEFQSIYGFRHADIEVFRAERERAEAIRLGGNFRSTPEVLSLVNAVGASLLERFVPLVARRQSELPRIEPPTELVLVDSAGWDADGVGLDDRGELDAPPARVAEAAVLARRLAEIHAGGFPRSEMVVLLRAFTNVTAYEEALDRAGLRPLVVGGRGYWSQQQVEDMRALLGVVANPLDDERLFGALASPACSVGPGTLWLLRRAADGHVWPLLDAWLGEREVTEQALTSLAEIGAADKDRLRTFHTRLIALRGRARSLPLDTLVDQVATDFGYDLAVLGRRRGRRRWANVRKLMALAHHHEVTEGRDLEGFLEAIDRRSDRGDPEPEAATELEGHDGVRIMTVHNAKGLEFGLVAVADLGRSLSGAGFPPAFRARYEPSTDSLRTGLRLARAGGPSLRLFDLEALAEDAAAGEAEEESRLAYVAASRARDHLVLSGALDLGRLGRCDPELPAETSQSALVRLLANLGCSAEDGVLLDPAGSEIDTGTELTIDPAPGTGQPDAIRQPRLALSWTRPGPGVGSKLLESLSREVTPPPTDTPLGARSTIARRGAEPDPPTPAGHLSHSALQVYSRCGYRFYSERILGMRRLEAQGGSGDALAFGNAAHGLLEWSARNRWKAPDRVRLERALATHGLSTTGGRRERLEALVGGFLGSELCAEIRAEAGAVVAEAPFLAGIAGTVVRGKLDLLVRRSEGIPLVVDYKTNALRGREPEEVMAGYGEQRDLYAVAADMGAGAETAFVFLEAPDQPVRMKHTSADLDAHRAALTATIERIRAGHFEVSPTPHRALCGDCPAREQLCSHPRDLTLAERPPDR